MRNRLIILCLFIIIVPLFLASCATEPEPYEAMPTPAAEPVLEKPDPVPRIFIPIQTVYAAQLNTEERGHAASFIAFHIDRRDGYSVLPERLVMEPGVENSIIPIVTLGKAGMTQADTVILRTSRSKYAAREPEYGSGGFDFDTAETADIPEFIIYTSILDREIILRKDDVKNKRNGIRRGIEDLTDSAAARLRRMLSPDQIAGIEAFLSGSKVFSDYEGIHSAALFPFSPVVIPDYSSGAELILTPEPSISIDNWDSFSGMKIGVRSREGGNPYPEITLGDMGVFSGGTVLIKPNLYRHTKRLVSMNNIRRMPGTVKLAPSPVTMEGSFNIYRDERNRYLWYPGIISYIPGFHPDISGGDINVLFNLTRSELDSFLETEGELYFGTKELAGGLPVFFLAAPNARALELGYERDSGVRALLAEFLNRPAYNVRLFE